MKRLLEIWERMLMITASMAAYRAMGMNNNDTEELLMITSKMEKLMKEATELHSEAQKIAKELESAIQN